MAATCRVVPNPYVGVPHGLSLSLDGETVVSYQWNTRTTPAGSTTLISGATSSTYTPTEAQAGRYLGCAVTFSSTGEVDNINQVPELLIRKHSAAAPGPRFVVRNHNTPRVKTSYEAMRESGNP